MCKGRGEPGKTTTCSGNKGMSRDGMVLLWRFYGVFAGGKSATTSVLFNPYVPAPPVVTTVTGGLEADNDVVFGIGAGGGVEVRFGHLQVSLHRNCAMRAGSPGILRRPGLRTELWPAIKTTWNFWWASASSSDFRARAGRNPCGPRAPSGPVWRPAADPAGFRTRFPRHRISKSTPGDRSQES